jgi:hypothetical protein
LESAFVEHDIGRHGLAVLAKGHRAQARRIYNFGKSVYPQLVRKNWKFRCLGMLLKFGPLGQRIAGLSYAHYRRQSAASSPAFDELKVAGP